jgi:hypothetical protein
LPWLQDTAEASVWNLWQVTYRDVVILDSRNRVSAVFNLTQHDLALSQNRDQLKALFLAAARTVDADKDGLPDDWEEAHFADLSAKASDDPDGDGANNFSEYAFGTDPRDPKSKVALRVTMTAAKPDLFTVTFRRRAGSHVKFIVETSTDLNQWSVSSSAIRVIEPFRNLFDGTGTGETTISLTTPIPSQSQAYVRVRAVPSAAN